MNAQENVRPPEPNLLGSLVAGYFKEEDKARKAIVDLRDKGINGDQIGVAMRSDEIPLHEKWISEIRGVLGKSEAIPPTEETTHEIFSGIGIEDRAAAHFEQQIEDHGGIVIGVRCDAGRSEEIQRVLRDDGADVARETLAEKPADQKPHMKTYTEPELTSEPAQPLQKDISARPHRPEEQRIQLMGEMLKTQKDRIKRGEVRIRKETVTEHQNVSVPVTREEVVIERQPGSGAPKGPIGEKKEIRIPVSEERARVEKEPVVTGEVTVQKRAITENQPVSADVRHEEVRVEKQGNVENAVTDKTKRAA